MRRQRSVRVGIAAIGVLTLLAVGSVRSTPTEAAWTEAEVATGSAITALDIPEPVSTRTPSCVLTPGLLGATPSVRIYWRIPEGNPEYTQANAEYGQMTGGLLLPLLDGLLGNGSTTGTASEYTTTINSGLLGGLLGGSKVIGIRLKGPGGWDSDWLVATASMGLLGANPQCSMSTAPSD